MMSISRCHIPYVSKRASKASHGSIPWWTKTTQPSQVSPNLLLVIKWRCLDKDAALNLNLVSFACLSCSRLFVSTIVINLSTLTRLVIDTPAVLGINTSDLTRQVHFVGPLLRQVPPRLHARCHSRKSITWAKIDATVLRLWHFVDVVTDVSVLESCGEWLLLVKPSHLRSLHIIMNQFNESDP